MTTQFSVPKWDDTTSKHSQLRVKRGEPKNKYLATLTSSFADFNFDGDVV